MNADAARTSADSAVEELRARFRAAMAHNDAGLATELARRLAGRDSGDEHAQAWLSAQALGNGDVAAARREAEAGLRQRPESLPLRMQLAHALAAAGDHVAAHAHYDAIWHADPRRAAALLLRGTQEEALGRRESMLRTYREALAAFRDANLLRADAPLAPRVRAALDHASRVLSDEHKAAFDQALAPLRERFGAASLRRIDRAIAGYLGLIRLEWPHPLQKPTLLLVPDLPPQAWFDPTDFPHFRELEGHTDAIREELLAVLEQDEHLEPYVRMRADAPGEPIWRELNGSPRWSAYHFYNSGTRIDAHCAACPVTSAAIDAMPQVRIPGCSPEILFSVLRPHTHIPPHTGIINGRLTVHLPLIVPPDCGALACGHEARPWVEGRCFVFDDSIAHEAINQSDHTRVVLIFDAWNPHLDEGERAALAAAFEVIQDIRKAPP